MCLSVNDCCCCITLNVGSKIISIVCTVTAAASVVLYGLAAATDPSLPPTRWIFYVTMAATSMLQLVCGGLLICGVYTKSPRLVWPWAAVSWLKAVCLSVLAVAAVVLLHYNQTLDTTATYATVIFVYFLYSLTLFYFVSVVNSRRHQMGTEARERRAKRLGRTRVLPRYNYIPSR